MITIQSLDLIGADTHDLRKLFTQKKSGYSTFSGGGRLLTAVDTVSQHVPHSNEAAKKARRTAESLQHYFGMPSYFLTVTPDDNNSILVQIYAGNIIDDETPVDELSDEDLRKRNIQRTKLRLSYPGVCALVFEYLMEIIIEDVIG